MEHLWQVVGVALELAEASCFTGLEKNKDNIKRHSKPSRQDALVDTIITGHWCL